MKICSYITAISSYLVLVWEKQNLYVCALKNEHLVGCGKVCELNNCT